MRRLLLEALALADRARERLPTPELNRFLSDLQAIREPPNIRGRRLNLLYMSQYDVRPPAPRLKTAKFSGGNQQKIVLAREIERHPKVLLVGQPTRGVDIGAIEFIHKRIVEERDKGTAVIIVSTELDEIYALSDRIAVMYDGRIVGTVTPDVPREEVGLMMAGAHGPSERDREGAA